jgi:hypothetical protein
MTIDRTREVPAADPESNDDPAGLATKSPPIRARGPNARNRAGLGPRWAARITLTSALYGAGDDTRRRR